MMFSRALLGAAGVVTVTLTGCGGSPPAKKTALLVIDVQDCFLEANTTSGQPGSLPVPASHIIAEINGMTANSACPFDDIVYSQDYHPENHISFGSTHGLAPFSHLNGLGGLPLMCVKPPSGMTADAACCPKVYVDPASVDCSQQLCPPAGWDYDINNSGIVQDNPACTDCRSNPGGCYETTQEMWTDHCLMTGDSGFPPSLNMGANPPIVQKGINQLVDAYSSFKDNAKLVETELDSELQAKGITDLIVVGIATDVCVKQSVIDAIDYGYTVTVIKDATAAVLGDQTNFEAAIQAMEDAGATITTVAEFMATECSPAGGRKIVV